MKTVEGWEKKKILECANNKTLSLLLRYVIVPRSITRSRSLSTSFARRAGLSLSRTLVYPGLPVALVLCSFRDSARTAVIPVFTSIRLTAPFVYMRARTSSRSRDLPLVDSICFAKTRRDASFECSESLLLVMLLRTSAKHRIPLHCGSATYSPSDQSSVLQRIMTKLAVVHE